MSRKKIIVLLVLLGFGVIFVFAQSHGNTNLQWYSFEDLFQSSVSTSETMPWISTFANDISAGFRFQSVSPLATGRGEQPQPIAYSPYDMNPTRPPQRVQDFPNDPFTDPVGDMPWGLILLMVAGYGCLRHRKAEG